MPNQRQIRLLTHFTNEPRTAGNQGSWSPFDTKQILTETVGPGSYLQRDTAPTFKRVELERDRVCQPARGLSRGDAQPCSAVRVDQLSPRHTPSARVQVFGGAVIQLAAH